MVRIKRTSKYDPAGVSILVINMSFYRVNMNIGLDYKQDRNQCQLPPPLGNGVTSITVGLYPRISWRISSEQYRSMQLQSKKVGMEVRKKDSNKANRCFRLWICCQPGWGLYSGAVMELSSFVGIRTGHFFHEYCSGLMDARTNRRDLPGV